MSNVNILITGASGLIGRNLISGIHQMRPSWHVTGLVRSLERARRVLPEGDWLTLVEADVNLPLCVDGRIDYMIHGAGVTGSRQFVDEPVDTIFTAVNGTRNMLELARQKQVKSFVFLSTMEVYGTPATDEKISETAPSSVDTMQKRSSYPESKRLCETMCSAYHAQYGVPAKVVRLTQTIGSGVAYDDGRVFAEFARCVVEKRNIVLRTDGQTRRSYLSAADAVNAIMTVLLHGADGEAYNAANEKTYCSILEMAELVAGRFGEGQIQVEVRNEGSGTQYGYAPRLSMNLDTAKLRNLGWEPSESLEQMYSQLIRYMKVLRKQ